MNDTGVGKGLAATRSPHLMRKAFAAAGIIGREPGIDLVLRRGILVLRDFRNHDDTAGRDAAIHRSQADRHWTYRHWTLARDNFSSNRHPALRSC